MEQLYNETLFKLETAINELELEANCPLKRIETVIHLIVECLSKLKEYVLKRGFKNTDEEIHLHGSSVYHAFYEISLCK